MWLLNTENGSFLYVNRPREYRYAVLSHVWRPEGEQSFQDLKALQEAVGRKGSTLRRHLFKSSSSSSSSSILFKASDKIRGSCALARRHGYRWLWIDSCCIDKTSSSELSEAINSMYEWYAAAEICIVFLDDVGDDHDPHLKDSKFRRSRWFTRGWTLQELIAPAVVVFFSKEWRLLGTKESLADLVEEITGIDRAVLTHQTPLDAVSVARRMSWASKRQTTREEDRAYSLMGIFGVNMPTIYGEGANAFIRLQEEILKHVPDQSIFAWGPVLYDDAVLYRSLGPHSVHDDSRYWQSRNLFAWSPDAFVSSAGISSIALEALEERLGISFAFSEYTITSYGMRSRFPLIPMQHGSEKMTYLAVLACEDAAGNLLALLLYPQREASSRRFYVGHYVGRAHVPPNAYFRAVSLSDSRSAELSRFAELIDVCIPYRPSLTVHRNPRHVAPLPPFKCPCDVVVPGWIASRLKEQGFAPTMTTLEESEDDLTLHITEMTSASTCALSFRSANQVVQISLGRCPCLGSFLSVSVAGSVSSGLKGPETMRSGDGTVIADSGSIASSVSKGAHLTPSCPTGHISTWENGSKEFVYGGQRVRLTFSAWLTRQDVYTLAVELLGTGEVPDVV